MQHDATNAAHVNYSIVWVFGPPICAAFDDRCWPWVKTARLPPVRGILTCFNCGDRLPGQADPNISPQARQAKAPRRWMQNVIPSLFKSTAFAYTVQNNSRLENEMESSEWLMRCSARLHAQWPRLAREQRDEVARDLWNELRWQHSEPEVAVVEWLSQGIPAPVGTEQ